MKDNLLMLVLLTFTLGFALIVQHPAAADEDKSRDVSKEYNVDKDKLAIAGYDTVSYHTGKPVEGKADITAAYEGVTYRFASEANKAKFLEKPDFFKPAYGGWCASAMAFGKKVEIDPLNYKLVNHRLMLFYKSFLKNARSDWNEHEKEWLPEADKHWKEISGEDPPKKSEDTEPKE